MRTAPARSFRQLMQWWGGIGAATALLYLLGRSALPLPPWRHPGSIAGWWRERGPLVGAFSLGRTLLLGAGCYLVGVCTMAMLDAGLPRFDLIGVLSRARLPGTRLVARTSLALTAAAAVATARAQPGVASVQAAAPGPTSTAPPPAGPGPAPAWPDADPATPPVLRLAGPASLPAFDHARPGGPPPSGPAGPTDAPAAVGASGGSGRARGSPGTATAPMSIPASSPDKPTPGQRPAPVARPSRVRSQRAVATNAATAAVTAAPHQVAVDKRQTSTWIVRPGDNLWSIASEALAAAWQRPLSVGEVAPYWWRVVQVNRPYLPIPSDPDLIFAGDRVTLPPPPAAGVRPG